MLDEITLRNVGDKQIYDSYMGILRISPSEVEGELVDSMSFALTNPIERKNGEDKERQIILSDSDGTKLGIYFTSKIKETDVINESGKSVKQNVVNIVTNCETNIFVSKDFHTRTTLVLNKKPQNDRISPLQVYHENESTFSAYDVLNYPIESPHDNSYFNTENKYELIDYNNSKDVHEQLKESLHNKQKSWYDENIGEADRVKIGDKFIFTQNKDYEEIPVVYTKDYVLGHYTSHTARITNDIKSNFVGTAIGIDKLQEENSLITKLSFIHLDKLVWDTVYEAIQGYIRHTEGRYNFLGIGENDSVSERLFGVINPPTQTSPLLATGVSPGIVMTHAMPFHRFLFHVLRQEIRNAEDEENDYDNLDETKKQYVTDKKVTAIYKLDPGFVNNLTKEFVLCDGKELNYDNYPSVNTDNTSLFKHNEKGLVERDPDTKKPVVSDSVSDVYSALKNSNDNEEKKLVVPSLLAIGQQSPRYIRGLNWTKQDEKPDIPIDFDKNEIDEGFYQNNDKQHEVVLDSDYGLTTKNFSKPGMYRMNVDWKATGIRHKHLCFFNSSSMNFGNYSGNSFGSMDWGRPTPCNWNVNSPGGYRTNLINYSFTKNKTNGEKHYPNSWGGYMPVQSAGLFAWKIDKDGKQANDPVNGYVIQNSEETPISDDPDIRKDQLEQINISEAVAPIANKGGSHTAVGTFTSIYCDKRKKTGRHNRLRDWYNAAGGGYVLRKAINSDAEVPRCVTSLPHRSIEKEKTTHEDPLVVKIGGQDVTIDTSLSFPPTTVLLPLFKI